MEAVVPELKKIMNAKADTIQTGKSADYGLLTLAVLIFVAGVAAYYVLPLRVAPVWHTLSVIGGIVVAGAVAWFTNPGRMLRSYLRETQFEMRKVVWPTREQTIRETIVVVIITVLLAIALGLIDLFWKWAILDHLLKL